MPDSSYSSFPSLPSYEPSGSAGETPAERVMMEVSRRHADFLNMASSAHAAYLNTVSQVMGGAAHSQSQEPSKALPEPFAHSVPAVSKAEPVAVPPTPAPRAQPAPTPQPAARIPEPVATESVTAKTVNIERSPQKSEPVKQEAAIDAVALVRGIIAEKTGYPEDMLDADMDLEGELGVDSIKQVEILSTLREQMPELPEIDPERLVELRTIAAIAEMISGTNTAELPPAATKQHSAPPMPAEAPAKPAGPNGKITPDVVRALIADKTGYPSDMLEDDMDLEGELGVDSIKQVEILSALREQHPDLPEVDPEVLVELRTIRAIADFFA